jgi:hypothetical protein
MVDLCLYLAYSDFIAGTLKEVLFLDRLYTKHCMNAP